MNVEDIKREISLLDDNTACITLLKTKLQNNEPDVFDIIAAGGLLQNFYNGIENIMKIISKSKNQSFSSANYHSELLESIFSESENSKSLFPDSLKQILKEYLGFRHVFRHSYGYKLNWERMKDLFNKAPDVWHIVKTCVEKLYLY